jgi:hypothetical protein
MAIGTFLTFRRMMVQTLIRLATGYEGGPWELVSVDEGPTLTTLHFESWNPLRDYTQPTQSMGRVRVSIETISEEHT